MGLSASDFSRFLIADRLLGACRELAPSKQESTTYEPSLVCKLLTLGCRLLIPDRLLGKKATDFTDFTVRKRSVGCYPKDHLSPLLIR